MARRKRQFLDDGDSSDSSNGSDNELNDFNVGDEDPDLRAERELYENPYKQHKRRKTGGKDDATYGVFNSDSEDEGFGGRRKTEKRSHWTKAPAFTPGQTATLQKSLDEDQVDDDAEGGQNEDEDDAEEDNDDAESSDSSGVEDEPAPDPDPSGSGSPSSSTPNASAEVPTSGITRGGIGSGSKGGIGAGIGGGIGFGNAGGTGFGRAGGIGYSSNGGIGTSNGGIGAGKGGIGSSRPQATSADAAPDMPASFGSSRPQRSFVRDTTNASTSRSAAPVLSAHERLHFNKIEGSFGARMLSKMGWQAGTGLGVEGTGIVAPIESKLRPKNMGIAFKGFKEKTEQSKAEARRRGEVVSDDEDRPRRRGKGAEKEKKERKEEVWKKPKKSKLKVEHKTYEQIIAEAGVHPPSSGIGQIIDATGATPREVASLADVSIASWTPTADSTRIPEVRHNIRLIADSCKGDLDGLAKEAKTLEDRRKWVEDEDERLRRKIATEAELIQRLQGVHLAVDDLKAKGKEVASSDYEPSLDPLSGPVEKLLHEFSNEFDRYRLDDIIVAAIAPIFRRMMASWKPLGEPAAFTYILRKWKKALKMSVREDKQESQVGVYGTVPVTSHVMPDPRMTPYESLLWNIWMPRIRTCINNEWDPSNAQPAVKLYEAWVDILPPFIRDNILDQLILPKISSAIGNWKSRPDGVSLQSIIFPWLPHVGLRFEEVVGDARRKMKSTLRSWATADGVPKDFTVWKEVFSVGDWDTMLLKYIIPRLGATLREDFRVNPRNQDMEPLEQVLLWKDILRPSVVVQLLEAEFFPKWLDILHIWLIQPSPSFEEIAQWYSFWKNSFPEDVQNLPGVQNGFTRGLQLMNKAIELGPDAPAKLPRPEHKVKSQTSLAKQTITTTSRALPSRAHEITFRSIVEEFVATHNLFLMPAGRIDEKSRMPLFRVSKGVDGRSGLLVYLLDDAVWASDGEDYRAISLENMVLRAIKG